MLMKKFYLSLLGALLALGASAQQYSAQPSMKLDSTYTVGADGTRMSKSVIEYDANGKIAAEYQYFYQNGQEQISGKSVCEYDDQGRQVKVNNYEYQNGEFVLVGYNEMSEFDAEGLPAVATSYAIDEENPAAGFQPDSKSVYKKYNGLNPVDAEEYVWDGSNWVLSLTIHYDYNEQGLPVTVTSTMEVMGMKMTNVGKMEYDEHGQIVKSESTSSMGISTTEEYVNTYDADGNLIKQTCKTKGIMGMADTEVTIFMFWSKIGSTAISKVAVSAESSAAYYDLNGRRLAGKPERGLFIHNGKKVFVK